jgi:hypothetical protein
VSEEPTRVNWRSLALDPECVLGPWARLAVCALCEFMGRDECYASVPSIARRMGTGERIVYEAIAELEREGFLRVERRAGTTNLYRRSLPPLHDAQGYHRTRRSGTPARTPARDADELDNEITRGGKAPEKRPDKIAELRRRVGWET